MIRFLIILCIVATMCTAKPVAACVCTDLGSLADEYRDSSAVFIGRIVSIELDSKVVDGEKFEGMVATFVVERRWKGPTVRRLRVSTCGTQSYFCTCGFDFQVGGRYVIFAHGKRLATSSCNRNTELPDLPKVEVAKIRAEGGRLAGDDLIMELDALARRKKS